MNPNLHPSMPAIYRIQQRAPFLRLPTEIRLQIFELILLHDVPLSISDAPYAPPICQVCFQIRKEAFDVYYGGNRFVLSNHVGLTETLDKAGADKISRMTRLQLLQIGASSMVGFHEKFRHIRRRLPERVFVDVDFLRVRPWYRMIASPTIMDELSLFQPALLTDTPRQGQLLGGRGLEAFRSEWDNDVRRRLMLNMMDEVLKAMRRGFDPRTRELNGDMLEHLVRQWIRVSHILTCVKEEPRQCDDCKWQLTALANALRSRDHPHRPVNIQTGLRRERPLACVDNFESTERELVRIDLGFGRLVA